MESQQNKKSPGGAKNTPGGGQNRRNGLTEIIVAQIGRLRNRRRFLFRRGDDPAEIATP